MNIFAIKGDNGGCGECACHCHSDEEDIPPGHLASCKFADPNYVPPGFREQATEMAKAMQHELDKYMRDNARGPS